MSEGLSHIAYSHSHKICLVLSLHGTTKVNHSHCICRRCAVFPINLFRRYCIDPSRNKFLVTSAFLCMTSLPIKLNPRIPGSNTFNWYLRAHPDEKIETSRLFLLDNPFRAKPCSVLAKKICHRSNAVKSSSSFHLVVFRRATAHVGLCSFRSWWWGWRWIRSLPNTVPPHWSSLDVMNRQVLLSILTSNGRLCCTHLSWRRRIQFLHAAWSLQ